MKIFSQNIDQMTKCLLYYYCKTNKNKEVNDK